MPATRKPICGAWSFSFLCSGETIFGEASACFCHASVRGQQFRPTPVDAVTDVAARFAMALEVAMLEFHARACGCFLDEAHLVFAGVREVGVEPPVAADLPRH